MTGWRYRRAVTVLRRGGVVAYPTEAVYGIGCDPRDRAAVARVFALKHRPPHKRCILIAADPRQLEPFVDTAAPGFPGYAARFWPGPVTLVAPARGGTPAWLVDAMPEPGGGPGDGSSGGARSLRELRRRPGVHEREPFRPSAGA